jgi:hypothetical protein
MRHPHRLSVALVLCTLCLAMLAAVPSVSGDDAPTPPSLLVLDASEKLSTFSLGGEDRLTIRKGDLVVNSCHRHAFSVSNSVVEVLDGQFLVVGAGVGSGESKITPEPQQGAEVVVDPYTGLKFPQIDNTVSRQRKFLPENEEVTLSPGIYYGGVTGASKATTVTLEPGVYVMVDGDFAMVGPKVIGKGVTIIMSGANPGKFLLGSGSEATLSAPTEGPLKDILIVSAGKAQGYNSDVGFNDGHANFTGVIYAPLGRVGAFYKSVVKVSRVVCFAFVLNTSAVMEITGTTAPDATEPPANRP